MRSIALKALIATFFLFGFYAELYSQSKDRIVVNPDIELIPLGDSLYIHTSWIEIPDYGRFPSNGMVIIRKGKALLIDTPNNNEQTQQLFDFCKDSMDVDIVKVIVGHFHSDCLGGLEFLHSKNVESISGDLTKQKCEELSLPIPKTSFSETLSINFEGEPIECFYPGGGHTADNIVVYVPGSRILFGGCLIKSINSSGLGNTADAVISSWARSVSTVISRYHDIEAVVPGHGKYGDKKLLQYTIDLVNEFHKK